MLLLGIEQLITNAFVYVMIGVSPNFDAVPNNMIACQSADVAQLAKEQ